MAAAETTTTGIPARATLGTYRKLKLKLVQLQRTSEVPIDLLHTIHEVFYFEIPRNTTVQNSFTQNLIKRNETFNKINCSHDLTTMNSFVCICNSLLWLRILLISVAGISRQRRYRAERN